MNKQTAVEFLEDKLSQVLDWDLLELFQQAKEMEKEQIMNACNAGLSGIPRSSEKYYNETYGGKDA
jgi:hypothetical protein